MSFYDVLSFTSIITGIYHTISLLGRYHTILASCKLLRCMCLILYVTCYKPFIDDHKQDDMVFLYYVFGNSKTSNCGSFFRSLQGNNLTGRIPEVIGLMQALAVL